MTPPATAPPSPPTPATKPPAGKGSAAAHTDSSSVKETLESILVAFILAFIFRAFIVEAFVIPSGSMAPTLLGAHMRYRCEDCAYEFDINFPSDRSDDENINIPNKTGPRMVRNRHLETPTSLSMHCPNCCLKVA